MIRDTGSSLIPAPCQDAVEEFAADAADEAFRDRVGPRRTHWCFDDADAGAGEDGVERGGELGVATGCGVEGDNGGDSLRHAPWTR
jgi:hypothetical protein